ncbi:hypothetical protein DKX38_001810 [Salix brachista]|uniref:RNase H type-1 domain-containing protein n=1 Tax=Salix brachista TaxID=2182728 RepID=A0A5N5NLV2_9ROSI|nr:hypothetical protein DKX38_001810 [Salix brachista]
MGTLANPVIVVHISDVELKVKDSWENGVCVFDKLRIVIPGDLKQRIMAIPIPTVSDLQSFLAWIAVNQHNEEQKKEELSLPINSLRYQRGLALNPTLLKKPISTALWPDKSGPSWDLLRLFRFERDHFVVGFTGFETNLLPKLLAFKSSLQLATQLICFESSVILEGNACANFMAKLGATKSTHLKIWDSSPPPGMSHLSLANSMDHFYS